MPDIVVTPQSARAWLVDVADYRRVDRPALLARVVLAVIKAATDDRDLYRDVAGDLAERQAVVCRELGLPAEASTDTVLSAIRAERAGAGQVR